MTEETMRHEANLVGPGSMAEVFEDHLDTLAGAVVIGDETTSIATLVFDAYGLTAREARKSAVRLVGPIVTVATSRGAFTTLIVRPAPREGLLSRLRRRRRARA